jgi:hypothetical protein
MAMRSKSCTTACVAWKSDSPNKLNSLAKYKKKAFAVWGLAQKSKPSGIGYGQARDLGKKINAAKKYFTSGTTNQRKFIHKNQEINKTIKKNNSKDKASETVINLPKKILDG